MSSILTSPVASPCLAPTLPLCGAFKTMDDSEVESTASILASVKEQEAQFEKLTRALEEERRHVSAQLERVRVSPQDASQTMANGTLTRRHHVTSSDVLKRDTCLLLIMWFLLEGYFGSVASVGNTLWSSLVQELQVSAVCIAKCFDECICQYSV